MTLDRATGPADRPRPRWVVGLVVCVLAATSIGMGSLLAMLTRSHTGTAPTATSGAPGGAAAPLARQPAPPLDLVDQAGAAVSLASARGHVVLLTFMDPVCTSLCPVMGRDIAAVEQKLPAGVDPVLLIVSVAPGRTKADVQHFVGTNLSAQWLPGWHWLLGPSAAALEVTWLHWHITVQPTATDISHDEILDVIDPDGYLRVSFPAPLPVGDVVSAISTVAAHR